MKKYLILFIGLMLLSLGCSNNETEPNNSFNTAQQITAGEYLGQKNENDSYDYFKVTAVSNAMSVGLAHLTPNASDSNFQVHVYNESHIKLGYYNAYNGIDKAMTLGVVPKSTYYIKIHLNEAAANRQYKLSVNFSNDTYETEPNNNFNNAQQITAGEYLGQNNGGDGNDYFKVTAANSAMSIGLTHLTPNASASNFQVHVYDVSKKKLGYYNAKNGIDERMIFGVTSGKTYYIKILVSGVPENLHYKLSINFSNDIYETEPNNTFNNAQQITAGEYLGQNNGSDSNDYFKITAVNSAISIGLTHLTPNASDSNFQVRFYDVSKKELGYYNTKNGIDERMVFGVISGNIYYVKVFTNGSPGNRQYKLSVNFSNDIYEIEPNDTFNNAQQITAGEYLGQNNGGDSYDYFKVIAVNNVMAVGLTHLTPGASDSDFEVRVYDVSKKELGYYKAKDGINKTMNFKVTSGNSYYVKIIIYNSDSNRQYKLKIAF